MDTIDARIALNEALFREVNQHIAEAASGYRHADAHYVCECGSDSCEEKVVLLSDAYRSIRRNKRHFFVKPGHEMPRAETVVERHDTYLVVEKDPEVDPILDAVAE